MASKEKKRSIDSLPPELIHHILGYSHKRAWHRLARACRPLYQMISPRLQKIMEYNRRPSHPQSPTFIPRVADKAFKNTKTVILHCHDAVEHSHQPIAIVFPNIKILHLVLVESRTFRYHRLCHTSTSRSASQTNGTGPRSPCLLLSNLKVETLILSGFENPLPNLKLGEIGSLETCSTLVLKIDLRDFSLNVIDINNICVTRNSAKTIVFVFATPSCPSSSGYPSSIENNTLFCALFSIPVKDNFLVFTSSWARLCTRALQAGKDVWMVNTGIINPAWLGIKENTSDKVQDRIKKGVEAIIRESLTPAAGRGESALSERIRWMDLQDLIKEGLYDSIFYEDMWEANDI